MGAVLGAGWRLVLTNSSRDLAGVLGGRGTGAKG